MKKSSKQAWEEGKVQNAILTYLNFQGDSSCLGIEEYDLSLVTWLVNNNKTRAKTFNPLNHAPFIPKRVKQGPWNPLEEIWVCVH